MHNVLIQTVVPSALAISLGGIWSSVWPYMVMLAGFSLIVFVHELGHFAVAKWAGVRVEKFAVGFGREVFGFTRGETRYCFNILPLGGYVKMLGQEDFDDKSEELRFKDDARSFVNKPVGHRMAIVSAGVIMNILFACFLFMIVFLVGMEATAPRIALVVPDSPAEKAGLLPGDLVKEINGETVYEFNEIRFGVLLAPPHEPIRIVVDRGGKLETFAITPEYRKPTSTRDIQRQIIGIAPGMTRKILAVGPEIDTDREDTPHVGDVIVEVDGVEVTDANASEIYNILPYSTRDVFVERPNPDDPDAAPTRVRVTIPPVLSLYRSDPADPSSVNVLGLTPLVRFGGIDPSGRAYYAGIEVGDTVLSWNDGENPSQADIAAAVRDNAERDIPFRVQKSDGRLVNGFVRPKEHKRGAGTLQVICESISDSDSGSEPRARVTEVRHLGVSALAGVEPDDVILSVDGKDNPTCKTLQRAVRNKQGTLVSLLLRKKDGRTVPTQVIPAAPGAIDASYTLVAEDLLRVGTATPLLDGKPSPAALADIPAGSLITAINGMDVGRWRELIAAFRENAGSSVDLAYEDPTGKRRTASLRVPHSIRTLLGVGPEARILTIDGRDTIEIEISGSKERVSVSYREGTRTALAGLVGRTQVPIEYRDNPMADKKTAHIDVTADMLDPWLGRVQYTPNILLAEERTLLKGENVLGAVRIGMHKTYYFIMQVYRVMERMIFTRTIGVENMSGPLGIIDMGGQFARSGVIKFLFFLAIISANLAVINFLPLPIVDGGLMVFLIIEKIKGGPVSLRIQVATQMIGLFLIIGMFLFVTYQDVLRLWG